MLAAAPDADCVPPSPCEIVLELDLELERVEPTAAAWLGEEMPYSCIDYLSFGKSGDIVLNPPKSLPGRSPRTTLHRPR